MIKKETFQQIDIKECELTTRYLLCQDAILHRIIHTTGKDIQRMLSVMQMDKFNDKITK